MSKELTTAYAKYNELNGKSKAGDKAAQAEKPKLMNEIRNIERQSARDGVVTNPVTRRDATVIETKNTSSRRSLQEEYVRRFDDKVQVKIDQRGAAPFTGTLREFHSKRLLGR